ncbi:MAG: IPT/TIG domain-containing protein [Acidobacteriota bacterium]
MMKNNRLPRLFAGLGLMLALGCSTKSPTAPAQTPSNPVPPPTIISTTVTVSVSPTSLATDSTTPATVTVHASNSDGSAVANGTQVTLTTSLGGFGSLGSGTSSVTLDLINGQATAALFPSSTVGVATLRAVLGNSVGVNSIEFRAATEFFLSSVEPNQGTPNGGTVITINGGGFKDPVRVLIGSTPAVVQSVSGSRIVAVTPRLGDPLAVLPLAVPVSVTIRANQSDAKSDTLPNGFIYASSGGGTLQPSIVSFSPTSGANEGGTRLTINGDGFGSPVQVLFTGPSSGGGGNISLEATVVSSSQTQVVVLTPAAVGFGSGFANQDVTLTVKNVSNGLQADASLRFHYGTKVHITSMGPGAGSYLGGTHVTIFGSGFSGPVAVSLGGLGQQVLSVTGSEIIFQTAGILVTQCPASGFVTAAGVSVVNIDTGDGDTAGSLGFQYLVPLPVIFGINPNTGSTNASATITGQNFSTNVQVLFGGATGSAATIVSSTASSIVVKVPPAPPGFVFNTQACDGNSDGIPGGTQPIPTPTSITVINLNGTGCTGTLTNAFTMVPPSSPCTGDTSVPPVITPQCSDGIDNDLDTLIDFPADPGCTSAADNSEAP